MAEALRSPRQDNRRRDLLDAAASLFCDKGYHATSMRDIAKVAGMLPGSMYYHFESKDELLLAVYREGVRRIAAHVDAAVGATAGPWQRLEAACRAHLEMLFDRSAYAQVLVRVLPRELHSVAADLVAARDEYERRFITLIDELGIADCRIRRYFRHLLLGAMNWAPVWYREGGESPRVIAREFVALLRGTRPGAIPR
jgi:AcrR family transcriptional regulator